jgi:hypothetical protein
MAQFRKIEILEQDNNKKGDLFGRLMSDLFHSLGYDEPRLNIHKSGREIDIQTYHRTERKIAVGECKAHKDKVGGDDINKFVGVLDAEKRKFKKEKFTKTYSVTGYFISLSGFKETVIEQEVSLDNTRVILLQSDKIVEELIEGRIIVSVENAISAISTASQDFKLSNYVDLFAYDKGWVWVLYYSSSGQKNSHFAFVHADGKPLIKELALELISLDKEINNLLSGLELIQVNEENIVSQPSSEETKVKYFKYLENECGEIQFEGLPTDKEAGSVRVKLESIFVPLHLSKLTDSESNEEETFERLSIGNILYKNHRLAILAKPGGGKSTLIKRLAIAYAFPERRTYINDELPNFNWFPIFIRCRELGEKVTHSITDIINGITARAEINECQNQFLKIVSNELQNGNALLLIDGLDEISEDRNRIFFVNQLRTFIATYPNINIIVTSREAGFRAVAGMLATHCDQYKVSNLIEKEIEQLTVKWHTVIIDDSENTIKEAIKISNLIINDNRIKILAENPLLLTTLLFVRRWAGYLPTKRTVLYQEMIKLLLVTWNVEGHDQLDIEEAEPQLAFVAYWMTINGQQTITEEELKECLIESRKQMPEILGYTKISPTDFIKRVESRSSLLILSGHKRTASGQLVQLYEFLHLSFQEYLTAKAIVKKYLPSQDSTKTKVEIIRPNLTNENWKEVIPIAAVLLERDVKELIELLITESKKVAIKDSELISQRERLIPTLLGSCIANEIQIGPELLDSATEWYAKNTYNINSATTETILNSKFGIPFKKRILLTFFESYDDKYAPPLGSILSEIFIYENSDLEVYSEVKKQLFDNNKQVSCCAILGLMAVTWQIVTDRRLTASSFKVEDNIYKQLIDLLKTNDPHYTFSSCWAISWLAVDNLIPEEICEELVNVILPIWLDTTFKSINRMSSWALSYVLRPANNITYLENYPKIKEIINEKYDQPKNEFDKVTSIYLGILLGVNWNRKDLVKEFNTIKGSQRHRKDLSKSIKLFADQLKINIYDKQAVIDFQK